MQKEKEKKTLIAVSLTGLGWCGICLCYVQRADLFQRSLQAFQHLYNKISRLAVIFLEVRRGMGLLLKVGFNFSYLQLDLCLSDVLFAAAAAGNFLCFGNLRSHRLFYIYRFN